MSADTSGVLQLASNNGTTAVTVDTSQNVGIGTTSSLTKLSIAGSESSYSSRVNISPGDNQNRLMTITSAAVSCDAPASGAGLLQKIFFGPAEGYMTFSTTNTERMRVDSFGNLLVGTTTRNGSEKMGLWYSSNSGPGLNIRDTTAQNGNTFIQFNNGGTTAGTITSNGTTTMTYGSASDYRLKKDLVPMVGALEKVALLQPKTGKWIGDDSSFIGFVAHELQNVFPDAIVGEKDKVDEQGNPVYQMIDTGTASLVATLTAAIQELKAELDALKAKVGA
jgi:hypothetical protein